MTFIQLGPPLFYSRELVRDQREVVNSRRAAGKGSRLSLEKVEETTRIIIITAGKEM